MPTKEEFAPFLQALWAAVQSGADSSDPAIQLGVRAFRVWSGEEELPVLVTDPDRIIEELRTKKSPMVSSSRWDPDKQRWVPRSLGSLAADQIERFKAFWKHNPMPPKPKNPPVEVEEETEEPTGKLTVFKCCNCGKPAQEDTRFMEGTNLGTCCGDQFIRKPK